MYVPPSISSRSLEMLPNFYCLSMGVNSPRLERQRQLSEKWMLRLPTQKNDIQKPRMTNKKATCHFSPLGFSLKKYGVNMCQRPRPWHQGSEAEVIPRRTPTSMALGITSTEPQPSQAPGSRRCQGLTRTKARAIRAAWKSGDGHRTLEKLGLDSWIVASSKYL